MTPQHFKKFLNSRILSVNKFKDPLCLKITFDPISNKSIDLSSI